MASPLSSPTPSARPTPSSSPAPRRSAFSCDGSAHDAREIGARIVAELQALRPKLPRLAGLGDSAISLPASDPSGWAGRVLYEQGVTRSTSDCEPKRHCALGMEFAPDGLYLWIQLASRPAQSQAVTPWLQIGPLYVARTVDGPPDDDTRQISRAVDRAIEEAKRAYLETCRSPE
jgi:hypothetical protein